MLQKFSYDLSDSDNMQEATAANKKREAEIARVIDDALSKFKDEFQAKNITYETRFLQGEAELEIFGIDKDSDLGLLVENSIIGMSTIIGASEH